MKTLVPTKTRSTALLLALALLLPGPRPAEARDVAAVITSVVGAVYTKESRAASFRQAKKGEFVYEGTTIKTGKGDKAALSFVSGTEVRISENTTYIVKPTHPSRRGQGNDTALAAGRMWFKVLRKQSKFEIKTPVAAVSVRGTEGDLFFGTNLRATCYEGAFQVRSENNPDPGAPDGGAPEEGGGVMVNAGQMAIVNAGQPPDLQNNDRQDNWQNDVGGGQKGAVKLAAERGEAARGAALKISLNVYDSGGHKDTGFQGDVQLYSDRGDIEFSPNGQGGWGPGPFRLSVPGGAADVWVRGANPGFANVTAQAEGYEVTPARFSIAKPPERELEFDVENEKGERKTLKMKFKR